ncbi:MAG: hypothetical protein UH625_06850 [Muribaculaceae bacterium]|nr:hypothetical protein [Muribaculaceae bacterium]
MNKNFIKLAIGSFAAILTSGAIMTSCSSKTDGDSSMVQGPTTRDSLQIAMANQDSLLVLMNDISEDMMQIKSMENLLANTSNLSGESTSRRDQIRNDMKIIQQTLQDRRERLDELEKKLKSTNGSNALLQKSIETLKQQIAAQEETIAGLREELSKANIVIENLNYRVDSLNSKVTVAQEEIKQKDQVNSDLTNEMNTVYYAIGTGKELKESGLMKDGGFLRSDKINPADFNAKLFIKGDKRTLQTIPLYSKKAKVMTAQPESSYKIEEGANGEKVLTIVNPAKFWNQSPYLVVKTD